MGTLRETQTGLDATVCSAAKTTADLGEDRCSSTPVLPLFSFGLAEEEAPGPGDRYWPAELVLRVIWPSTASGKYLSGATWTFLSLQFEADELATTNSDNGRKPYGAPSELRWGKAGTPLLKGQKPDIASRFCGQAHRWIK